MAGRADGPVSAALRAVAPVAAAVSLACAGLLGPPAHTLASGSAFFWEASHADKGTLYLLGSVHVGDRPLALAPGIRQALARSDELVVEADIRQVDEAQTLTFMRRHGLRAGPEPLRDVLRPETWEALVAWATYRQFPMALLEPMAPWLIAQTVIVTEAQLLGYDMSRGVDLYFLERAGDDLPVRELEGLAFQAELFGGMDRAIQDHLLADALNDASDAKQVLDALFEAWRTGDEEALRAEVFPEDPDDPRSAALVALLIDDRNMRMVQRLTSWADDGRTRFVVVGAGHLVGDCSLPALLQDAGWTVRKGDRELAPPSGGPPCLELDEATVATALPGHQGVVAAALDDAARLQEDDLVGLAHRREPMGDHHHQPGAGRLAQ